MTKVLQSPNGNVIQLKKRLEEEALMNFTQLEKDLLLGRPLSYDFRSEVGFVVDSVENHTRQHPISFLVMDKNMSTCNKETF